MPLVQLNKGNLVAVPPGTTQKEAMELVYGKKKRRRIRLWGLIVLLLLILLTGLLASLDAHSLKPAGFTAVAELVLGAVLHFFNKSVELFGGRRLPRRIRKRVIGLEQAGELVWVLAALKRRADKYCQLRQIPVSAELFSYDMGAARRLAELHRKLRKPKRRKASAEIREWLTALVEGAPADSP